jgi:signal transduction histidine kinase
MENKPIRLLAVEDNPGDFRLVQEMLSEAVNTRFTVQHVNRFSAAVEYILKGNLDVILLDLSLPDTQGLETFRSVYEKTTEVPIVVLTAIDDESTAIEAVRGGAQDYLVKGKIASNLLVRALIYAIQRKKAEKIMQELREKLAYAKKMAAVGTLTGGVAHKISNPLAIILTNVQLLKEKLSKKTIDADLREINELADKIESVSVGAKKIILDLLFFTRDYKFELKPVNVRDVIREALASDELNLKEIKIVEDYADGLPQIPGNFDRLADTFLNIAKNACESMLKGGIFRIKAKKGINKIGEKEFVEIDFIDSGCGIPAEKLDKVFEPFFSTKEMHTGLGLSIARGIIELHYGTIAVKSCFPRPLSTAIEQESHKEFESGTTVIVRLPAG